MTRAWSLQTWWECYDSWSLPYTLKAIEIIQLKVGVDHYNFNLDLQQLKAIEIIHLKFGVDHYNFNLDLQQLKAIEIIHLKFEVDHYNFN